MFPNTIIFKFIKGLLFCLCVVEGDSKDTTEPNCPQTSIQQAQEMTFEHVDPGPNQASGPMGIIRGFCHNQGLLQPPTHTHGAQHQEQLCCSGEHRGEGRLTVKKALAS